MPIPAGSNAGGTRQGSVQAAADAISLLDFGDEPEAPTGAETTTESPETAPEGELAETPEQDEVAEPDAPEDEPTEDSADEPEAEEPEADEPEKPRTFKVKKENGEGFDEVPETELINGYLRQSNFTKKTQALAKEKQDFLSEREAVTIERREYATSLTKLREAIESVTKAPDWKTLKDTMEPAEFAAAYSEWDINQKELDKLRGEEQRAYEAAQADIVAQHKELLASEREKLVAAVPEWSDPKVGKQDRADMLEYALSLGFEEQEISSLVDHRAMLLLRKAMLFDRGTKKVAAAKKKVDAVRVAAPGAPKTPVPAGKKTYHASKERAKRSGRVEDAAAVIGQIDFGDDDD
jgi:hypothetical protein